MSQPGLERAGCLRGGAPSAIESKQHGSNSAFAALTAIDCISEETSSVATDSVVGSCPASRESTAHGGLQFFHDSPCSSRHQGQGLMGCRGAAQQQHGSLYGKAGSSTHDQPAAIGVLAASALLPLHSGSSHPDACSSESTCDAFTAAAVAAVEEQELQHDGSYVCSSDLRSSNSLAEQVAASDAAATAADPLTLRSCLRVSDTDAAQGPAADICSMPGSPTAAADKAAAAAAAADISVNSQKRVRFTVDRPAGTTPSRDYSLLYAAPELLSGQRPTEKVDVFAFGVLLYELLSRGLLISHCAAAVGQNRSRRSRRNSGGSRHGDRHSPLANASSNTPSAASDAAGSAAASPGADAALPEQQLLLAYAQMVAGGYRPPFPAHIPGPVAALISSCWAAEPHERPRMSDVTAQVQAWSQDRQLVACLDSYLAGLADLGYGPGNMAGPSCGCGCVVS
eukprot:GHRQ01020536.1.p1 GENE.GHRQ01020536.1~~GHRQ01020536.1.p1  ORF type:complete len:472 (+),score=177.83 GHRQ01020536.1:55-1416(+)